MSRINAFSRVLNQKVKTRFFMDFQLMDNLNMTAEKDLAQIQKNKKGGAYIASHMAIYYSKQRLSLPP